MLNFTQTYHIGSLHNEAQFQRCNMFEHVTDLYHRDEYQSKKHKTLSQGMGANSYLRLRKNLNIKRCSTIVDGDHTLAAQTFPYFT